MSALTPNEQEFMRVYADELFIAFRDHPKDYMGVYERTRDFMLAAIVQRTFNKEGRAFKATCKRLHLPHTYKAIFAYLNQKEDA